ncbi:MAG: tRNA-dihydrouridine synthase family protein [Bacteroides sp.]|nr:tRNA-dihydrouridine synthase family protein [Bacteroides sp.]MCM1413704.1 tRNA-dihydrouridine synthase family protein [Bacteroides sp.]MCM1471883.1 tRNA-dihydrouridine synthase family protein [Bacteroides sp.]
MNKEFCLYAAPLQGFTEAVWRFAHSRVYGSSGDVIYFTPFVRLEKGRVRDKDLRDVASPMNAGLHVVPQVIFRDVDELGSIVDTLASIGVKEIDLNLGCPFQLQVRRGRGAALLGHSEVMDAVAEYMCMRSDVAFSVKMRLGCELPDEWRGIIDALNRMPLSHVAVHPRTAAQQYGGELQFDEFSQLVSSLRHPVIFNGEIKSPEDIADIVHKFPNIKGVMVGRGLQARPSLFDEWNTGRTLSEQKRLEGVVKIHDIIFDHYKAHLCGDAQILSKIKPFWTYLEPLIGHKPMKSIKKATTLSAYTQAIATLR